MPAQDPYRYFRVEARELLEGLREGARELEQGVSAHDRVSGLLRLAHTLKGAARVVKQPAVAELAHSVEEILSPHRDVPGALAKAEVESLLGMLEGIGSSLAALEPAERAAPLAVPTPVAPPLETLRVDIEEVELLLSRFSELGAELARFERETETLKQARRQAGLLNQHVQAHFKESTAAAGRIRAMTEQLLNSLTTVDQRWGESVERFNRELGQGRELANQLRLLPSSAIFPALERVVRDAGTALGKSVSIKLAGGGLRLDADVLVVVRDALIQLLRNAVAHGIEEHTRRVSAGKSRTGNIEVRIERRGSRVAFVCRDDGAGVDLNAIRHVAVQKGLIREAEAQSLDLKRAIDMLFRGGVSTACQVSEISGRGIGLDIVRAAVARLGGEIDVETEPGLGTRIEIRVQVSLVSVMALTVHAGDAAACLPLDCVRQTLRLPEGEIVRCGDEQSIAYQGRAIPFLPLASALESSRARVPARPYWSTVIVALGSNLAAIGVEKLICTETVLVRSLPALVDSVPLADGVTLDHEGNCRLFLVPAGLVQAANQGWSRNPVGALRGASVLVIDDSLTTRMVEQSILESAGFEVELATSGEEALEKARSRPYSLFLVDIEMPGMDGFEFISRTRRDPSLRDIPAVLVTSRVSPEDRKRGEEAGARAHIVKSEFDQSQFLETIRKLVR